MTFAEMAGNMWDDAGAAGRARWSRRRGNTITGSPRTRRPSGSEGHRAGDRGLDQAASRTRASTAASCSSRRQGAARQVREGLRAATDGGRRRATASPAAPPPGLLDRVVDAALAIAGGAAGARRCAASSRSASRRRWLGFQPSPATSSWCRWRPRSPCSPSCPTARRGAATSSSTPSPAGCRRAPTRASMRSGISSMPP